MSTFAKFGELRVGSSTGNTFGDISANKFWCQSSGRHRAILVYLKHPAGDYNARAAIYADNSGVPGALIAESAEVTITAEGWYAFLIPGVLLQATLFYWFAMQYNQSGLITAYFATGGAYYSRTIAYGAFPNPFGAGSSDVWQISIYSEYNEDRPPFR